VRNKTKLLFGTISLVCFAASVSAQGITEFISFEQYPLNTRPAFIKGFSGDASVTDGSSLFVIRCPPFEGQKYLGAYMNVSLESPNANLIQSYTLHLFIQPPGAGLVPSVQIGGQFVSPQVGVWQTIQSSFSSPVREIPISTTFVNGEEGRSVGYAIDALEFTTVPEPKTFLLLTIGAAAIALRRNSSIFQIF